MKLSKSNIVRKGVTLALMTAIVFGSAAPAFADPITQGITAGTLTASLAAPTFAGLTSTHAVQPNSGGVTVLTADDSTGNALGWDVSIIATDMTGSVSGTIPAEAISVLSAGTPTSSAGHSMTGVAAGTTPTGAIDVARTVLGATAGNGQGTYQQNVALQIDVPANIHSGTYSGTFTVTNTTK